MVTGAARYTVDVKLPGMLIARILRSPYPHARILSVDTSAAERYPGVRAVHVVTMMEHPRGCARHYRHACRVPAGALCRRQPRGGGGDDAKRRR